MMVTNNVSTAFWKQVLYESHVLVLSTFQLAGPTIMHYSESDIPSRAGLVALVFALIISLVSAVPIPVAESGLSSSFTSSPSSHGNPSLNGFGHRQDHHIQLDTTKISLSGRMSTLPAATRALTRKGVRYCLSSYLLVSTGPGLPSS